MGLLSLLFFFHLFILVSIAYVELPIKYLEDGSKSSFVQAPYISAVRDETVKEIQEEITNSWPEGIITYYLDDKSYDLSIGDHIRTAMSVLEAATCIRFRGEKEKPDGSNTWIHITNPKKKRQCVHDRKFVNKKEIMLILGYDCLQQRDLLHSLLHGIGFKDEVTHPHRERYIKVLWDNIQPAYSNLYKIQPVETSRSIVEYDPLSIMHFHDRAFSSNGKATIVPLESGLIISPSENLSQLDKMRLQLYFGHECNKRKFSSFMETCKKSLKGEQNQDVTEEEANIDKVNDEDHIEHKEKTLNSEENAELVTIKGNEEEKDVTDENVELKNVAENKDGKEPVDENNVSEDIKKTQEEKENNEENIAPTDIKENQKLHKNSDANVESEGIKENKSEKENDEDNVAPKRLKDSKEENENPEANIVSEDMKKDQDEKGKSEENPNGKENSKQDDIPAHPIVLKGSVLIPIDNSLPDKKIDSGIDLNLEPSE